MLIYSLRLFGVGGEHIAMVMVVVGHICTQHYLKPSSHCTFRQHHRPVATRGGCDISCFGGNFALKVMERYTAEEAASLLFDNEYVESGESDIDEDPSFPLPSDQTRKNSQDVRLSQLRCEQSAPPPTAAFCNTQPLLLSFYIRSRALYFQKSLSA